MKKSVVLTLIAVYILSICVVGYFGLKVKIFRPTVYSEQVVIKSIKNADTGVDYSGSIRTNDKNEKSIRISNPEKKEMTLIFVIDVYPDNTTNKELNMLFGSPDMCEVVQGSPVGGATAQEIIIKFKGSSTVTFTAKDRGDGKNSDTITVSFKNY